jgi:hypothetical protein
MVNIASIYLHTAGWLISYQPGYERLSQLDLTHARKSF